MRLTITVNGKSHECISYVPYIVYRLTNLANGKVYIGFTAGSLENRFKSHIASAGCHRFKSKIGSALVKYGSEQWDKIVLQSFECKEDALAAEIHYIAEYDSVTKGYNITPGGECGAVKGPRPSICGAGNPFYGKTHTAETLAKIADRPYRSGADHHFYGKTIGTSFKAGDLHPRSIPVVVDGIRYGSISIAARYVGLSCPTLQRMLKRGNPRIQIARDPNLAEGE